MTAQTNKDLVRRYSETIWNNGQLEREAEFVAPAAAAHVTPIPGIPGGAAAPSAMVRAFRASIPDLHLTQDLLFGDGDKVVQVWTARGFHSGEPLFGFPAAGKELVITGINIFRLEKDRIVERWGTVDLLGLMQQLGVAPASPADLNALSKGWYM